MRKRVASRFGVVHTSLVTNATTTASPRFMIEPAARHPGKWVVVDTTAAFIREVTGPLSREGAGKMARQYEEALR